VVAVLKLKEKQKEFLGRVIILNHTLEEVNLILSSLAKQSYETVHELIEKIKTQAVPQVQASAPSAPSQTEGSPPTTPEEGGG